MILYWCKQEQHTTPDNKRRNQHVYERKEIIYVSLESGYENHLYGIFYDCNDCIFLFYVF